MRVFILINLLFISCLLGDVKAQNKAWQNVFGDIDVVNPEYMQQLDELRTLRANNGNIIEDTDDDKGYAVNRSGKKYDKVVFNISGLKLYAPAKIEYEREKYRNTYGTFSIKEVRVLPLGDIYYLSNNQLFCHEEDIDSQTPYKIRNNAMLYNEDGSIRFSQTPFTANGNTLQITTAYLNKATPLFRYPIDQSITEHRVISPWIFESANFSKSFGEIINRTTKGLYRGSTHTGVFNGNNGEVYTGYFAPIVGLPNGGVLFKEEEGKTEWVLVIGGNTEMTQPAMLSEKPKTNQLQQTLVINPYTGNGKYQNGAQTIAIKNLNHLGSYSSQTVNGYGIKYTSSGDPTPGKDLFFEVGIYKNGKLNGLGYRVIGKGYFDIKGEQFYKIEAEAGIFENGLMKKGRKFNLSNPEFFTYKNNQNYWVKPSVSGFASIDMGKSPIDTLQFYDRIDIGQLAYEKNPKVFIQSLNRWATVTGRNQQNNMILKGDYGDVVLNSKLGNVYYESEQFKTVRVGCPKTKEIKKYKTVTEDINWKDSQGRTIITEQDRSGYLKPVKLGTSKKDVFEGYEKVTCNICNGRGYIERPSKEKKMYKLTFSDVKDEAVIEASLFGTKEHLEFEANAFLQLFELAETRTYKELYKYNNRLQYEWIEAAANSQMIYEAFAELFYLIYQKNKSRSYYFISTIHSNSFKETLAIVSKKYPEARAYIQSMAKQQLNKK